MKNKLTLLPNEIGGMCALEVLNVNQNTLRDLPSELYSLPLRMFGIDDNPLNAIPDSVVEGGSQEIFDFLGKRLKDKK